MRPVGEPYDALPAGTSLWHVYSEPYAATAFNPFARGRFSGKDADPPRKMYYAGETSECALWETVLRDVCPSHVPPHEVTLPPLAGAHLAHVVLNRELTILDLGRLPSRWISGSYHALRDRIAMLTVVPRYNATYKTAAQLLTALPLTQGLCWPSKQTGRELAYLFYDPSASALDFTLAETIALESSEGLARIDQALACARMKRLDVRALAATLTPPPDPTS